MMGRQRGEGSVGSPVLPTEQAAHTSLFLCRGSRGAYAPPCCLWLPQHLLAQHDHDEDATIATCVREGKSREQVSKGTVSREAGGRRMASCAGSSRLSRESTEFARIAQVCALRGRQVCMCARCPSCACGPAMPDDGGDPLLTSMAVWRFNPGLV